MTKAQLTENLKDFQTQAIDVLRSGLSVGGVPCPLWTMVEEVQAHRRAKLHSWAISVWLMDGRRYWFEDSIRDTVLLMIHDTIPKLKKDLRKMVQS